MKIFTVDQLTEMDEQEFVKVVREELGWKQDWTNLLDPDVVWRTRDALFLLLSHVDAQIIKAEADQSIRGINRKAYLEGARLHRTRVCYRLSRAKNRIKEINPPASPSKLLELRQEMWEWKQIVEKLAEVVDETVLFESLNEIKLPDGERTVLQWLEVRRERAKERDASVAEREAAKAADEALADGLVLAA